MPFRSARQRAYLYANHPTIAKRWTRRYGGKVMAKSKGGVAPRARKRSGRTRSKNTGKFVKGARRGRAR